jgi:hypothetical protein
MHWLSFFGALALFLPATQALAECNSIGCIRPTNALERLFDTAERTFSVMRVTEPISALGLCGAGNCATEPAATPLPKNCGSAGCATPEPKARPSAATANDGASIDASILVTDAFAAVAERPIRPPPAVPWAEWAERWGFGGLYKPSTVDWRHRS